MNTTQYEEMKNYYGVQEVNGLVDPSAYYQARKNVQFMGLGELQKLGGRVTRLRFLTGSDYSGGRIWDVSYCHAELPDGTPVHVHGGPLCIPGKYKVKGELIAWAKSEGAYAKGLGLLDEANWSVMY